MSDTFENGESLSSVRSKINTVLQAHSNFGLALDASLDAPAARIALERQDFSTRAALVAWATGKTPATGLVMQASGIAYRYDGVSTAISDLPGWVPDGVATAAHFGADLTGAVDAREAVSAMLDYVNSIGGGLALMPAGTYKWAGYLSKFALNNVVLQGEGAGTKINRADVNLTRPAIRFWGGHNNRIRDMTMDCAGWNGTGMQLQDIRSGFDNVRILNCPYRGLQLNGGGNTSFGLDSAGRTSNDSGFTTATFFPEGCFIDNCEVTNSGNSAINCNSMPNISLTRNRSTKVYQEGITADRCSYSIIENNRLSDVCRSDGATAFPDLQAGTGYLSVGAGGRAGISTDGSSYMKIVGNILDGVETNIATVNNRTRPAISFYGDFGETRGNLVEGNTIGNAKTGIRLKGVISGAAGNCFEYVITNNHFETTGTASGSGSSYYGDVCIDQGCTGNVASNNNKIGGGQLLISGYAYENRLEDWSHEGFNTRADMVAYAPTHAPKFGTIYNAAGLSYRYDGVSTAISDLPGWVPDGVATAEHYGAVGDGVTDDTTAVLAWLNAGGGEAMGPTKTYMIGQMVINVPIKVRAQATFKQRSGFLDWTAITGLIECRHNTDWEGGTFDGNRNSSAVNSGMSDILGTSPANIISNKFKASLYINAQDRAITTNLDNITFTNCINFGLMLTGSTNGGGRYIDGRVGRIKVTNSGAVATFTRCRNMPIGSVEGWDIDNRIGGNNEYFFPFSNNTLIMGRSRNCPVGLFAIYRETGRPGAWLTGVNQFIVPITQVSCTDCPISSVQVRSFWLPITTASDTAGKTIASLVSPIGFSDVSNTRCGASEIYVEGDFSEMWEIIPGDNTSYGSVTLWNTGGEQGVGNGSVGVACHGGQRYEHNQSIGRSTLRPEFRVETLEIRGGHYGLNVRTNTMIVGTLYIRATRNDGVLVGYNNIAEWGDSHAEVPNLIVENVDIQWCGGEGYRVTNGGAISFSNGVVANNCQMSGYTDPTTGIVFTRSAAGAYDPADTNAGAVGSITMNAVSTDSEPSFSRASGASFLPRTPLVGTVDTINDARVNVMAMAFINMDDVNIGQRLRILAVDAAGVSSVDVWPRAIVGNVVLVEVASAQYSGAWGDNLSKTNLSGTWTITAGGIVADGVGGSVYSEVTGGAFIYTPSGYVLFENPMSNDQWNIQDDKTFGATFDRTLTAALSGVTVAKISVAYTYTQRQTVRSSIVNASVALSVDNDRNATSFGMLTSAYAFPTSTTALQKLFNWSTNGELSVQMGVYKYECVAGITGMDAAAASNCKFDVLGAGTATIGTKMIRYLGHDTNAYSSATTGSGGVAQSTSTPASMSVGVAAGAEFFEVRGVFIVTGAGTIIPSVALVVAASATVGAGSYFQCTRIGLTALSQGWS